MGRNLEGDPLDPLQFIDFALGQVNLPVSVLSSFKAQEVLVVIIVAEINVFERKSPGCSELRSNDTPTLPGQSASVPPSALLVPFPAWFSKVLIVRDSITEVDSLYL